MPDAIETNCIKCTDTQKLNANKITHYLIDNHPIEWERLAKIYDKNGIYKRNYLNGTI